MSDFALFEKSHHENFSSSLLAFAMRQSPAFAVGVMNLIRSKCGRSPSTQMTIRNIRREYPIEIKSKPLRWADIYVEVDVDRKSLLCLVEAKINSREQENQLLDYHAWLSAQKADDRILATICKFRTTWSTKPHAELWWADLKPLVAQMSDSAAMGSFEKRFWSQFKDHLGEIMVTFEGFTLGFTHVHRLMQEVDGFLHCILDKIPVAERRNEDWKADRAMYKLPDAANARVGFYWWPPGEWANPARENTFCVVKDTPERKTITIASFQDIVANAALAQQQNHLDEYVAKIAERVRQALEEV